MKKLLTNESRRLGLLLLFCITVCMANAFEKDGLEYSFGRDNTLTIVKLSKDFAPVSLIIPERVEYESNTYEVTRIGMDAFSRCESLESVNLPETITSIEIGAFYGCKALKEVNIPRKVKNIETGTFSECSSLTTITLPYGLIWITSQAFEGCNKLMDITSLATFPPYIDENSFPIFGTLHVRQGAKAYYENEDFWKNFNIVEDAVATDDMLESYIPFAEADKTWAMLNFDNSASEYAMPENNVYIMSRPTTLNGKEYFSLTNIFKGELACYIREEGKKIYMLNDAGEDVLLYDFGVREGDEVRAFSYLTNDFIDWKVTKTSRRIQGRNELKEITLIANINNQETKEVWLENVGVVEHGQADNVLSGIHTPDGISMMEFTETMESYIPFNFDFTERHIHGQSFNGKECYEGTDEYLEWEKNGKGNQLKYEFIGDKLHVYGKYFAHGGPHYYVSCHDDEEKNITLDFDNIGLSEGLVLFDIDIMFAGFTQGTYTIVDNGKKITLECTASVESITSRSSLNQLYDLQGRRLIAAPTKGIFIKDGKKVVK